MKKTSQNNTSQEIQKNNINNPNIIKLREEETNVNKVNINNAIDKQENNKKNINNPQFIVNKNVNNNINNISPTKIKNRTRFFSFDDDMSSISQWNNLNLKKIEISNNKLIIDNYNINHPDDLANSNLAFQPNNISNTNNFFNNNNYNNNSNNVIITRKNSAFSAFIK